MAPAGGHDEPRIASASPEIVCASAPSVSSTLVFSNMLAQQRPAARRSACPADRFRPGRDSRPAAGRCLSRATYSASALSGLPAARYCAARIVARAKRCSARRRGVSPAARSIPFSCPRLRARRPAFRTALCPHRCRCSAKAASKAANASAGLPLLASTRARLELPQRLVGLPPLGLFEDRPRLLRPAGGEETFAHDLVGGAAASPSSTLANCWSMANFSGWSRAYEHAGEIVGRPLVLLAEVVDAAQFHPQQDVGRRFLALAAGGQRLFVEGHRPRPIVLPRSNRRPGGGAATDRHLSVRSACRA